MERDINGEELAILESDEFNSLLEAVEMMAKAQGNLSHLNRAVGELKNMMDSGSDSLPLMDEAAISDIVESMQNLMDDLASSDYERK